MPLSSGTRLGPYEILAPLGAGGMGEVYRARDSKLNRHVAIKCLPTVLAADPQYMARFEREAQVLASLNHANIATVYGIEEGALVMELVPGQTLAARIAAGPVPIEEAIPIARQMAEGLEAAHDRGIVHRDFKPGNVMITPQGVVKLLDFGLAKPTEETAPSANTISPTLSMAMTQAGMILGTAAYMAPEQAAGKPVDKRADIWAFGVVLYEMLSGKRLFEGETIAHTLAHVLTQELDLGAIYPAYRPLLRRCLQRNPRRRMRDIGEARLALDEPIETSTPQAAPPTKAGPQWLAWAVAAVAILAAGAGWWRASRPPELRPLVRMNVEISPDMPLMPGNLGGVLALSPDGMRLAVTLRGADGNVRLYTRLLQQSQLTPLASTEGASTPFFSPDGRSIGFSADGALKKISVEGGVAIKVCDAPNMRGASWGDDGSIVFTASPNGGLSRVSSAGGAPAPFTKLSPGELTHRWPQVLAGSQTVLFTAHSATSNYDDANIEVLSLKTGQRKTVYRGGFSGRYVTTPNGSGHLLYVHQNTLFAAPFDLGREQLTGDAVPVIEEVRNTAGGGGDFTVSPVGTLVYLSGKGQERTISWVDRTGKKQPLHTIPGLYHSPRISPDGKRLAFAAANSKGTDIWVMDLDRDAPSRLSFLDGRNYYPVWTPDGKGIVFKSTDPARPGLYWTRSDGAGEAVRLTDGQLDMFPNSISPDGKRLAYSARGSSEDLFTAIIEGDSAHPKLGKPELFLGTPYLKVLPAFSPDGRWIAYVSLESGIAEVVVRPFPGPGGRWQISTGGGDFPVWSRDGRELFFRAPDSRVMVVSVTAKADSFFAGTPSAWPETRVTTNGLEPTWDLAPDGKRMAVFTTDTAEQKAPTHLTFLLNFLDELQRRK